MKLPIIRHLQKNNSKENLMSTVEVLESFCEHRLVTDEEMDVVGELLTNIFGAIEVHEMVDNEGMTQTEAARVFSQKVMSSID